MASCHSAWAKVLALSALALAATSGHAQTEPRFYSLHPSEEDMAALPEAFAIAFGDSVAIEGRTAMVGMPRYVNPAQQSVGRVGIFEVRRDGTAPRVGSI